MRLFLLAILVKSATAAWLAPMEGAMDKRKHCRSAVAAVILTLGAAYISPLQAQSWPQRAVRLIVPVGAGSSTDITARIYADRLVSRWKQPVIVENRPGADGLIGTS